MQYCYDYIDKMSPSELAVLDYQAIGPHFTKGVVSKFGLMDYVPSGVTFDPVCWNRTPELIDPNAQWDLSQSYSLHLFHGAWNRGPQSFAFAKNNCECPDCIKKPKDTFSQMTEVSYPAGCLYEQLKRRYL
jgi:hypothetical protein